MRMRDEVRWFFVGCCATVVLTAPAWSWAYFQKLTASGCNYASPADAANAYQFGGGEIESSSNPAGVNMACPFNWDANVTDTQIHHVYVDFTACGTSSSIEACWTSFTGYSANCTASVYAQGNSSCVWANPSIAPTDWLNDTTLAYYTNVWVHTAPGDLFNGIYFTTN